MRTLSFSVAVLVLPLLMASRAHGTPAAPAAPAPDKVVGPPEVAWKDMTTDQKMGYMKAAVTPKMKTVFQDHDAATFKKVTCATCHGKNAKARKFKMPGPDIHPLPTTPERFQAMMKAEPTWPKWTKFMAEKVEPQMAALLGLPAFDPKKPDPKAFSCKGCHRLQD